MNILIINPNSSLEMTKTIQHIGDQFAMGDFDVHCKATPTAPPFIETYEDEINAIPGMIDVLKKNESQYDAFVIACHYDPHLDIMKEISTKPVVGIGEASMKMASMLGHRFSIITTDEHSIPIHHDLVRKYNLEPYLASIRVPSKQTKKWDTKQRYVSATHEAVHEDMAEVIVLGCAGLAGLDKFIQKKIGIPILDGVICALIITWGLVEYQVSNSKIRKANSRLYI